MITIVDTGSNWVGIYRDGELVDQDHLFTALQLLKALGIECECRFPKADIYFKKSLPQHLAEVELMS